MEPTELNFEMGDIIKASVFNATKNVISDPELVEYAEYTNIEDFIKDISKAISNQLAIETEKELTEKLNRELKSLLK